MNSLINALGQEMANLAKTAQSHTKPAYPYALSRRSGDFASAASSDINSVDNLDDIDTAASSGYGHHSGYGPQYVYAEEEKECETGLNPFLLAGTVALAGAAAFLIFNQITTGGKRKRSISLAQEAMEWLSSMTGGVFFGLEDFEGKIDQIASGVDKDENSWINQLYQQFHGKDDSHTGLDADQEGIEAPVLIQDSVDENRSFAKRSADDSDVAASIANQVDAIYADKNADAADADNCATKFVRCAGSVAADTVGAAYRPGGVTGLVKDTLLKMAFSGSVGNMWSSLMSVPQARKFQLCVSKRDECLEKEIITGESNSAGSRVVVVPENLESADASADDLDFEAAVLKLAKEADERKQ